MYEQACEQQVEGLARAIAFVTLKALIDDDVGWNWLREAATLACSDRDDRWKLMLVDAN